MEYIKNRTAVISDQDTRFEEKLENRLQTLSLNIKMNTPKLVEQYKKISFLKESYNERLENMSTNNKVSTKFEIKKKNMKRQ